MQKHERECLAVVRGLLEPRFKITTKKSGPKLVIYAANGQVADRKHISSSPRDSGQEIDHIRQWAQRLLKRAR